MWLTNLLMQNSTENNLALSSNLFCFFFLSLLDWDLQVLKSLIFYYSWFVLSSKFSLFYFWSGLILVNGFTALCSPDWLVAWFGREKDDDMKRLERDDVGLGGEEVIACNTDADWHAGKPLGCFFGYLLCFDQNVQMSNIMCWLFFVGQIVLNVRVRKVNLNKWIFNDSLNAL